jgi:hypothetical protein
MRPNAHQLAKRDPALMAVLGLEVLGRGQADFGGEFSEFGIDDSQLARQDVERGMYVNASHLDRDVGDISHLRRIADLARRQQQDTERRLELLDPNRGSTEKIERFTFSLNQELVLGIAEAISMTNNPTTDIKPEKLLFNAPCFNFALINVMQIGNLSVIIGGFEDAANYGPTALGVHLSMPLLRTSNRAQVTGEYTGLAPAPYTSGGSYSFTLTLQGPARMTI